MKRHFTILASVLALLILGRLSIRADELSALAGKWVATRSDDQGQSFQQALEIKKNKFTFKVQREGQILLYAEGEVKTEPAGPLKIAKFFNISGGRSQSDLQPVDDERTIVYLLTDDQLTVAANFDRERSEAPSVTKYTRAAEAAAKTLVIDKIVMNQKLQDAEWYLCFEATVDGVTKRFNLPNHIYSKNELTVEMELAVPNVRPGATCKFVMKMDDVAGDECTEEMDNRSAGSFTVSDSGSQEFKPENAWRYTIHWHLK